MANVQEVTTGEVRLSYVNLFQPRETDSGLKYSVTILLPKSDVATKQRIDAALQAAKQEGIVKKWNGACPPNVPIPIHDGDGTKQDGSEYGPECKGHWVFSATQQAEKGRVEVVDVGCNPIINQSEIYSGVYGRVNVRFAPYLYNGKKGIACYLGPVQKLRDGEPLAAQATSAANAFGGAPMAAPAPAYAPPAPAYAPPAATYAAAAPAYAAPVAAPVYAANAPAAAPAIDPITGQPVQPPVMGL